MKEEMGGSLQWESEVWGRQLRGKKDLLKYTLIQYLFENITMISNTL